MKTRKDGNCIKCGSDRCGELKGKFFNERFYSTMKCDDCGSAYDIVYDLVLIQSQEYKTIDELLKEKCSE